MLGTTMSERQRYELDPFPFDDGTNDVGHEDQEAHSRRELEDDSRQPPKRSVTTHTGTASKPVRDNTNKTTWSSEISVKSS